MIEADKIKKPIPNITREQLDGLRRPNRGLVGELSELGEDARDLATGEKTPEWVKSLFARVEKIVDGVRGYIKEASLMAKEGSWQDKD